MQPRPSLSQAPDDQGNRLQLFIDTVSDHAIYMLDAQGLVSNWNTGAERLKGYSSAEIIGQHYSRFFTPQDRASGEPERNLARARAMGRCESEGWRLRKDGTTFWASAVLQAVHDLDGELIGFAKITRDITAKHNAELALAESERRFRMLVDGVVDYAICMLDPGGVVTNWNTGAERIKGYTSAEIIGTHFSVFYSPEDRRAGVPARVIDIATREGRYEAEGWRVRKDGSRFWAAVVLDAIRDDNGRLVGFAKVTRDITERRQAQEALQESERQFRMFADAVNDYALIMLDPNGVVTKWNAGAARIKGYTADEIIGQHFSRFYPENERAAGTPSRTLQTAESQGRYEAEGWRVRKDGSLFWANVVVDPIRDERGRLVGFAKVTRDITERRAAQKALQETQAQLAQSQKMEALGQLTGGVAHDFNNLLTIVYGNLRTIKRLVGSDPKGLAAAEAIEVAAQRGAALTRQLLTFSRHQSVTPIVMRLDEGIAAIRAMLSSTIGALAQLAMVLPPDLWNVRVDPSELELALLNLALNARDAMPQGGTITISAENVRLAPGNLVNGLEGEFVAVTVADTGQGIPADILPKVFDPFFTTKAREKGTGLGLSQVHGFTHQAGGTVAIESELGRGTRVTLYLPRSDAEPAARADNSLNAAEHRLGGRALLMEDNPEVLAVTKAMLEDAGYQVHTVTDADAAIQAVENGEFDLVLSDIVMAGPTNGFEIARRLRRMKPDLPILLATGYSEAAAEAAAEFIVLRKPYLPADLNRALARLRSATQPLSYPDKVVSLQGAMRSRRAKDEPPGPA